MTAKTPPAAQSSPTGSLNLRHPAVLAATWFGAGLLPKAPGTWGSLAALPFAWLIATGLGSVGLFVAIIAVFLVGLWASEVVVRKTGRHDPSYVVIDEVAGQWLALLFVPPDPLLYGAGFLLFRIADILKPWPASWADRNVSGGLGIMLDDLFAALYVIAVLALYIA